MAKWQWVLRLIVRRIWFRAALFSVFAVVLALLAAQIAPYIPYKISADIGAKAVDNILNVLASSMLAVTTFSLTAMVQGYSSATSNVTPRAVQLLLEDSTSQNALSTFLGSFLFAIVGIIALSTGFYGESGRVILYIGTIIVVLWIAVTLLRWIAHVSNFGRVGDTIKRVEQAADAAARTIAQRPHFGGRPPVTPTSGATAILTDDIGNVTHIDMTDLDKLACEADAVVHLAVLPGTFVDCGRPLAWIEGQPSEAMRRKIAGAFTIARARAFDQDPRFGLVVLSEIASRALSPAVNDPGTAIAVLEAGTRVLATLIRTDPKKDMPHPRVRVPAFAMADMLEDLFRPIARDGAALIEVQMRLQKSLGSLLALVPEAGIDIAERADDALSRAMAAMTSEADKAALRMTHDRIWRGETSA